MQKLIDKIKSVYILKNIIDYIKDNRIQFKLFQYSKKYQNNLKIKVSFQKKYLKKIGFNISNYLYTEIYDKEYLNKKYNEFLLEKDINKKKFEDILLELLQNENIDNIDENIKKYNSQIVINIDSPLLNIISKIKDFYINYIIKIYEDYIDDNYKLYYNRLNTNSNINNSLIDYDITNIQKLKYLKNISIDIDKILGIYIINENEEDDDYLLFDKSYNFIYLHYFIKSYNLYKYNNIELNNLYSLDFRKCEDISLSNIFSPELNSLFLRENKTSNISILEYANFKKLKELYLDNNEIIHINSLEKVN